MKDRRQHRRFPGGFQVRLIRAANNEYLLTGETEDISAGGLLLVAETPLEVGQRFVVEVDKQNVQLDVASLGEAEVVHVVELKRHQLKPNKFGMRFTKPDEDAIGKVLLWVQSRVHANAKARQYGRVFLRPHAPTENSWL
jgi:c-di-GMP-binding flagellar brake protein YcgR